LNGQESLVTRVPRCVPQSLGAVSVIAFHGRHFTPYWLLRPPFLAQHYLENRSANRVVNPDVCELALQLQTFYSVPFEYQESTLSRSFIHCLLLLIIKTNKYGLSDFRLVTQAGSSQFLHIDIFNDCYWIFQLA
jgi:hypothetical protein